MFLTWLIFVLGLSELLAFRIEKNETNSIPSLNYQDPTDESKNSTTALAVRNQPESSSTEVALRTKRQFGGFGLGGFGGFGGIGCCGIMPPMCCGGGIGIMAIPHIMPPVCCTPMIPPPIVSCCGCCMPVCMPICMRGGCMGGCGMGGFGFGRKKRELIMTRHKDTLRHFLN